MLVFRIIRRIFNRGTESEVDPDRRQVVRLINQICAFVILLTLPYVFYLTWSGETQANLIQALFLTSYVLIIFLNRYGFLSITRIFTLIVGNLHVLVMSAVLGIESNIVLYYFAAITASLFFFRIREWHYILAFASFTAVLFLFRRSIHDILPPPIELPAHIAGLIAKQSEIGALLAVFVFVSYFYYESQKSQASLHEANRQLLLLSETDPLTNISNRRKFSATLEIEWQRAFRGRYPLAVIFGDVDQFKAFNDHHGHQAGDRTLFLVAEALGDSVRRAYDFIARYGGEEFVAILPETTESGAADVANRMREAVIALRIEHGALPQPGPVTISFGVASTIPSSDTTPAELIRAADEALFGAKERGRNRVSVGRIKRPARTGKAGKRKRKKR